MENIELHVTTSCFTIDTADFDPYDFSEIDILMNENETEEPLISNVEYFIDDIAALTNSIIEHIRIFEELWIDKHPLLIYISIKKLRIMMENFCHFNNFNNLPSKTMVESIIKIPSKRNKYFNHYIKKKNELIYMWCELENKILYKNFYIF